VVTAFVCVMPLKAGKFDLNGFSDLQSNSPFFWPMAGLMVKKRFL
jgi:hypothetical protein